MKNKGSSTSELGEIHLSLSLESNMIDYAKYFIDKVDNKEVITGSFIDIKLATICCASFYELYFKFRLGTINSSLIWSKPEQFDSDKHQRGEFQSKKFSEVIAYAKNFNWINADEKEMIEELEQLRNQVLHFSFNDNSAKDNEFVVTTIKYYFFDLHKDLVIKLLKSIETSINKYNLMMFFPNGV